jgi:cytidylate kinase
MKQQKHKINIAIDGYSSCGKSTLAKALAEKLHYIFIDSGAMYRAITLYMIKKGFVAKDYIDVNKIISSLDEIELHFENNLQNKKPEIILNNENVSNAIRSIEVNAFVSKIATIKEVRKKLVK